MNNHHFDDYDLTTNDDRRAVKDLLNLKFNQRCKSVEKQGRQYIYDEQSKYASDILSAFKRKIHLSTFVAPVASTFIFSARVISFFSFLPLTSSMALLFPASLANL